MASGAKFRTVNDCEDTLTIVNATPEIARASVWLERFANQAALPPNITSKLQVALDEIVRNVFVHALPGAREGARAIGLAIRRVAGRVELEIVDDGPEFDPTGAIPEHAPTRIAERRPGGVGILFVKSMMDDIRFTRLDGRNRLTMALSLPPLG